MVEKDKTGMNAEMPDIVHLLSESVANRIAAGEVVQRPASVVKELVENSIDAGATSIEVIIKDAGRTLIQVVDNGKGMSPKDARMAFEHHATSKITRAEDLFSLHTMGFRGEALPSIAAVSTVDMRSMRPCDEVGTRLVISGSKVESQTPEACVPGTNIMVKNIFSFIPARRKFLKNDNVELGHIVNEFEKIALINPGVEFKFVNNEKVERVLRKADMRRRILDIIKSGDSRELLEISAETEFMKISGFLGAPSAARKNNRRQYFFVNGRNMRHPSFHRTVMAAYEKLISRDCLPTYFINFDIDPSKIDVNIHPQKFEIKFDDESIVKSILSSAVRATLGREGTIMFDVEDAPEIPCFTGTPDEMPTMPSDNSDSTFNPFLQGAHCNKAPKNWQTLYSALGRSSETLPGQMRSRMNEEDQDTGNLPQEVPTLASGTETPFGKKKEISSFGAGALCLNDKYIVSTSSAGLLIVDRFRAHFTVIYKRLSAKHEERFRSQSLIFPEFLELSVSKSLMLKGMIEELEKAGFDISQAGGSKWVINGIPDIAITLPPKELLLNLMEQYENLGKKPGEQLGQTVLLSLARAAAVKAGTKLSQTENDSIISELLSLDEFAFTPDGFPILKFIPSEEIEHMF